MPSSLYRSHRVLVVEDDEDQLKLVVEMLIFMGHDVVSAKSSEEAMGLLQTNKISVLVTDVCLPNKSGIELASEVYKNDPSVSIVFTTGNSYLLCDPLPFKFFLVSKPFHYSTLQEALSCLQVGGSFVKARQSESRISG